MTETEESRRNQSTAGIQLKRAATDDLHSPSPTLPSSANSPSSAHHSSPSLLHRHDSIEFVATGLKKDDFFFGDISTSYKGQNTIVDLKVDSHSSVATKVTVTNLLPSAKAVVSFKIPDHKSGKLDVQYVHPHATLSSSIGLNPTPLLDLSATIGSKDVCLGGEVGFDTASSTLTKYNAGISINKPDLSVAVTLEDKGESVRATYVHMVNPTTSVGAELIQRIINYNNSFTVGTSHALDPTTVVKTRYSSTGKAGMVVQREWRPKSLITFSAEYDSKAVTSSPKLGLALALMYRHDRVD